MQTVFDENPPYPDYVIACVGGGSNSIGIFRGFLDLEDVKLIGIEAGGRSAKLGEHAMSINYGEKGIFQGSLSFVVQNEIGQIAPVHSISAGLDYPGVGPEHAYLYTTKRATYEAVMMMRRWLGFIYLPKDEGIMPALESSHAIGYFLKNHKMFENKRVLLLLSGRGDKDMEIDTGYEKRKGKI